MFIRNNPYVSDPCIRHAYVVSMPNVQLEEVNHFKIDFQFPRKISKCQLSLNVHQNNKHYRLHDLTTLIEDLKGSTSDLRNCSFHRWYQSVSCFIILLVQDNFKEEVHEQICENIGEMNCSVMCFMSRLK